MQTETTVPSTSGDVLARTQRRAVLVAALLLGVAAVIGLPIFAAVDWLLAAVGSGGNFAVTYLVAGSLGTLSLGLIAWGYLRVRPVAIPIRVPTRRETGWAVGLVVASFVLAVGLSALSGVLGVEAGTNLLSRAAAENPVLVYGGAVFMFVFLVGPLEELLYRGVVQGRLREVFGPAAAIGFTSLLFALGHVLSYWIGGSDLLSAGVLIALVGIGGYSVLAGVVYERTQNLAVVVVAHSLINGIPAAAMLVAAL